MKIKYTEQFLKEVAKFSEEIREDLFKTVELYLSGARLSKTQFRTFNLAKGVKIQEFKVRDSGGNLRAFSFLLGASTLTFVYAFNKKSQKLLAKEKKLILRRVKEVRNEQN